MEHKEGVKYELSTKTKAKDQIKANKQKKTPEFMFATWNLVLC